jgi:hypothetical protein
VSISVITGAWGSSLGALGGNPASFAASTGFSCAIVSPLKINLARRRRAVYRSASPGQVRLHRPKARQGGRGSVATQTHCEFRDLGDLRRPLGAGTHFDAFCQDGMKEIADY